MPNSQPLAFSYIRFSTAEQALGDSERRQITLAERYAEQHGLRLDTTSFVDHGVSAYRGKNAKEGALRRLLDMAEAGDIPLGSVLIVESMDRLSRSIPRKAVRILEDLCEHGLTVVTLDNRTTYTKATLDSDPMAFMLAYLVAIRAHEESARKGRRLAEAWAHKRTKANSTKLTARGPYWLQLLPDRGSFAVIPERVEVVRSVFADAMTGMGQEAIARRLNSEEVPTFGRGERWHKSTISKLIRNEAVIGTYQPHKMVDTGNGLRTRQPDGPAIRGYYPAIIPEETFAALQATLTDKRAPYVRTGQTISNPLAGMVRCGLCGASMTRVSKGERSKPRLVCSRAKVGAGCEYHSILMDDVWRVLADPHLLEETPRGTDQTRSMWAELEAERLGAEEHVANLSRAIAEGGPSAALQSQLRQSERELDAIEKRARALLDRMRIETPNSVQRRLEALQTALEDAYGDAEEVNRRLRENLSSVTINPAQPAESVPAEIIFHWLHGGETTLPLGGFGRIKP